MEPFLVTDGAGESLAGFARLQRLSVAELLRQSNRFWVVDMQGTTTLGDVGDEEDGGPVPMQVLSLLFPLSFVHFMQKKEIKLFFLVAARLQTLLLAPRMC